MLLTTQTSALAMLLMTHTSAHHRVTSYQEAARERVASRNEVMLPQIDKFHDLESAYLSSVGGGGASGCLLFTHALGPSHR